MYTTGDDRSVDNPLTFCNIWLGKSEESVSFCQLFKHDLIWALNIFLLKWCGWRALTDGGYWDIIISRFCTGFLNLSVSPRIPLKFYFWDFDGNICALKVNKSLSVSNGIKLTWWRSVEGEAWQINSCQSQLYFDPPWWNTDIHLFAQIKKIVA